LPPLCAIAVVLDSAKTAASVMIETFIVSSSLWSLNNSNHTDGLGSARLANNPEESDPRHAVPGFIAEHGRSAGRCQFGTQSLSDARPARPLRFPSTWPAEVAPALYGNPSTFPFFATLAA
jgi:hypothetical protein